jgi:hypothetical protein
MSKTQVDRESYNTLGDGWGNWPDLSRFDLSHTSIITSYKYLQIILRHSSPISAGVNIDTFLRLPFVQLISRRSLRNSSSTVLTLKDIAGNMRCSKMWSTCLQDLCASSSKGSSIWILPVMRNRPCENEAVREITRIPV